MAMWQIPKDMPSYRWGLQETRASQLAASQGWGLTVIGHSHSYGQWLSRPLQAKVWDMSKISQDQHALSE